MCSRARLPAQNELNLTLSQRRPISYRNQIIDLQSKSMDWFLYDIGLRYERFNYVFVSTTRIYKSIVMLLRMNFSWKSGTNRNRLTVHFLQILLLGIITDTIIPNYFSVPWGDWYKTIIVTRSS